MLSLRCDWKLWLDKVTNKVLRSVCSSHLCWPWLSQFPRENSLKVHWHESGSEEWETERRTIKRSRLMAGYFVWTDESVSLTSGQCQPIRGRAQAPLRAATNQKLGNCHHFAPITIGLWERKMVQIKWVHVRSKSFVSPGLGEREEKSLLFSTTCFFLRSIRQLGRF